jgi:hypothetical protein
MPAASLHELQRRFAAALAEAQRGDRVAIYRNTIRASYRSALAASYPVVRALVGAAFFDAAVDAYEAANPSRSGDLNVFGDRFGDFIAAYPHARELQYLPDVARLEWAIDEAGRSPDAQETGADVIAALAAVPAEALARQRFRLDASCRLLTSPYPVLRIWQVHQHGAGGELTVDFDCDPDNLLVRREAQGVAAERLAPADFAWLHALHAGAELATAVDRAVATDASFDLGRVLQTYVQDRTIVAVLDAR